MQPVADAIDRPEIVEGAGGEIGPDRDRHLRQGASRPKRDDGGGAGLHGLPAQRRGAPPISASIAGPWWPCPEQRTATVIAAQGNSKAMATASVTMLTAVLAVTIEPMAAESSR